MTSIEAGGSSDAERLRRLQALDELLPTLAGVLDIREVFDRISHISQRVIPHDMIALPLISDDKQSVVVHAAYDAASQTPQYPRTVPMTDRHRERLFAGWDHNIFDDLLEDPIERDTPPAKAGMRSLMRLAIKLQGETVGVLDFGSRIPHLYSPADVLIGRRIADYLSVALSHQRLAEESRRAARLQERTANLEMLDGLLSAVTGVLDIREIFGSVSEIAGKVLAHDGMGLAIMTDDGDHIVVYATTGVGLINETGIVPIHESMRRLMNSNWEFDIVDDLRIEARGFGPERLLALGFLSVLRAPIRISKGVTGLMSFFSRTAGFYKAPDALIARRIAGHMAMLMSHQRMAEESKRVAALQERAANLEMLDGLLSTLAEALDVRDVFEKISGIASKVLPHDMCALPLLSEDKKHFKVYANSGGAFQPPSIAPLPQKYVDLMTAKWDYIINPDLQADPVDKDSAPALAGYRAQLLVPVRIHGEQIGGLSVFSRQPNLYTQSDALVARRIADHIALALSHQRLAEESRRTAALKERAANLEMLDGLLNTLAGSLDIREVFEQVSVIAQRVLPHDLLSLPMVTDDRKHLTVHAIGGGTFQLPDKEIPLREHHIQLLESSWDHLIMPDLQLEPLEKGTPPFEAGYRGRMTVPIRLQGQLVGALDMFSLTPNAYSTADVLVLRRIADHIALVLSHQRLAEQAQRAAEARERASLLERRVDVLTAEVQALGGHRRVIGESKQWKDVLKQATQVASTETTVLLLGDSGTGKEVVARFIHRASARAGGPFVALNCAALPEQLLESELFGYERGAFTGALNAKPGQIEQASGGVLFLDEVSEMSLSAQAKFLRVLQEKEFQRLGGTRVMKANARVIAATNRDLTLAIERGTFREDLYYRLHVFEIALPRLRDRPDDVLPLSEAFIEEISRGFGRPPAGISREARRLLVEYHWPGNVRQLRNTLERAAILCEGGLITGEHLSLPGAKPVAAQPALTPSVPTLPSAVPTDAAPSGNGGADLKSLERAAIEKALRDAKHNKSKAAKLLGLTRTQLYVRLRKYGLES